MPFCFSAKKAVQVSAYIIGHRQRRTTKLDLMKLLYFVDRLSIQRQRHPITGDDLYAMDHGPVASRILDLINDEPKSPIKDRNIWSNSIRKNDDHVLLIVRDPGCDELSEYEIELIDEILSELGQLSTWALYRKGHELPEWIKCHLEGTSTRIPLSAIAEALGCVKDLDEMEEDRELDLELAHLSGN